MRRLIEFICAIIFYVLGFFVVSENLQPELLGMGIGATIALVIDMTFLIYTERHFIKLYWDCFKPWGNKELRLTIAYLYRIEFNGKYLLVKNQRFERDTYQPVGGVYKFFHPEAKSELDELQLIPDTKIKNDDSSEFDLRFKMLNRKKMRAFIKWFLTNSKREIDPWREFHEELIKTSILPANLFGFIYYELVGQHFEPIHYDKFFEIETFKYVDIYKPRFINEAQLKYVRGLINNLSDQYIWVTEEEIKRGVSDSGKTIAEHTYKIFTNQKL